MSVVEESALPLVACSFCGRTQKQARKLVSGKGVYICDACVDLCQTVIKEEFGQAPDGAARAPVVLPYGEAVRLRKLLIAASGNAGVTFADVDAINRFSNSIDRAALRRATGGDGPTASE